MKKTDRLGELFNDLDRSTETLRKEVEIMQQANKEGRVWMLGAVFFFVVGFSINNLEYKIPLFIGVWMCLIIQRITYKKYENEQKAVRKNQKRNRSEKKR